MNEELQKAIAELFNSAISAKDFLVGELPEYINQLLMWHAAHSALMCFLGVLYCAAWFYPNYRHVLWLKNGGFKKLADDGNDIVLLFHLLQFFLIIPVVEMFNLDWLKIMIAPKVWLVEYAASLVK